MNKTVADLIQERFGLPSRVGHDMPAAVDAGLVLQGFIPAAAALRLGCCPISVVRNHVEKLAELLALPAGVFPVAGLCVGYPSQTGWSSMRLPPALTVHTDRYDDH